MKTAVITTSGLGTRMLTFTKSNPKTMLPVFTKSQNNSPPMLKPLIEYIFENLYDLGFRRFCFVVGPRTKAVIVNHLKSDLRFIKVLKTRNLSDDKQFINALQKLNKKIQNSEIKWIIQEKPSGFGDALQSTKNFVKSETFLLHAGDTYFPDYNFLKKMISMHENLTDVTTTMVLKKMENLKGYGIAEVSQNKNKQVISLEEKPRKPKSNFAVLPVYAFKPEIFDALKITKKGYNNELQVTDAIMTLITNGKKVYWQNYGNKKWFDIGRHNYYFEALFYSYKNSLKKSLRKDKS